MLEHCRDGGANFLLTTSPVCMYVYVHIYYYILIYIQTYIRTHLHTYHIFTYIHIDIHIYVCLCVWASFVWSSVNAMWNVLAVSARRRTAIFNYPCLTISLLMLPCPCLQRIPQVRWHSLHQTILEQAISGTRTDALCASRLTSAPLIYLVLLSTQLIHALILLPTCLNRI